MVVNSNLSSASLDETTVISCSMGQWAVQPSVWGKTGGCLHLLKAISYPHPREPKSFSLYVREVLLPSNLSGNTDSSFFLCFMPKVDFAISPLRSPHGQGFSCEEKHNESLSHTTSMAPEIARSWARGKDQCCHAQHWDKRREDRTVTSCLSHGPCIAAYHLNGKEMLGTAKVSRILCGREWITDLLFDLELVQRES